MDYAISHHTVFMPAGEYIRKYRDEDKFIVFCRRCNRYDRCWARECELRSRPVDGG